MPRLLLIDGSNLLFQMFFGMPSRIVNADGKAIQGTLGFVGALLKIIRMTKPSHLLVLFDGEHENTRAQLNPDYKANRTDYSTVPYDENPFSQLPDICAALNFLGIPYTEAADCEADDVLAAYALRLGREAEVIISSFDSDFFQLITENISVLRYRGEKTTICTPAFVAEKFGILPGQYADFKSLTGDSADNLRGAEKVGPKTAAALLSQFGNLQGILENAAEIKKPSVRESVIRNAQRLRTNYELIKLKPSSPLPFPLAALSFADNGKTTTEVLMGIGLR